LTDSDDVATSFRSSCCSKTLNKNLNMVDFGTELVN